MAKPTPAEIETEVALLKELARKVRPKSFFGDDNRQAVEAQIHVLRNPVDESDLEDMDDWTFHELENAREALRWKDGDADAPPSQEWAELC